MTPGARIEAALQALATIGTSSRNVDTVLRDFFRGRRYAGSGDRRAVTELVYEVLRHRGELLWRCGDDASWRRTMLAFLIFHRDHGWDEVEALFAGGTYDPAPLSDDDRLWLGSLSEAGSPPVWARGNFPAWLADDLGAQFGDAVGDEMAALNRPAAVDIRVNRLKTRREEIAGWLAEDGIETTPTDFSPDGLRLAAPRALTNHDLYEQGAFEVQDEGSQLVARLTDACPGEQIVDLCAGAGGKTLALAAAMGGSGQIYAFDNNARRLERMRPRLERAGVRNVQAHQVPQAKDKLAALADSIDRVLIDAPCSGTGTWRRHPSARWRLRPDHIERHCVSQAMLLREGAGLVRPGGRLVYATCSVLFAENQRIVRDFLGERDDFRALDMAEVWTEALPGVAPPDRGWTEPGLLLTPARHGCDAFYICALERREG
ncbi:MAG: RsmB/NOP family class I SAM-dependent RNA methyltransferase [Alphaproteobacteria bacterium]